MKKYFNLHLIAVVVGLVALYYYQKTGAKETHVFFGFAENRETEIRVEHPITILEIKAKLGSKVEKGDEIMTVKQDRLELEKGELEHEMMSLQSEYKLWQYNLKSTISQIQTQKEIKINEIQRQVDMLESKQQINKSLIEDLKSIEITKELSSSNPVEIQLQSLKKEIAIATKSYNTELQKYRNELFSTNNPFQIQINQLKNNLNFVTQEKENLTILAPNDGIIGTILCKEGEQFPSFETLMTIYEEKPSKVKGYVLESLILHISIGDDVLVNSSVLNTSSTRGKVVGMGSRIIEIPERLRKNPIIKTYGREIIIKIPKDNSLLQKEKVTIKFPVVEQDNNFLNALLLPHKSGSKKTTENYIPE